MKLHIKSETGTLRSVLLGTAQSNGPTPKPEDCYDPMSLQHVLAGTYPKEQEMMQQMDAVSKVLKSHGVEVLRPRVIENCNQIFARDIAFVIEDKLIKSNILPDREKEFDAITYMVNELNSNQIIQLPHECHVEGGDVLIWHDYIFVGTYSGKDYPGFITARTNVEAVRALQDLFPHKKVKSFELKKSNTNPQDGALHLDCCFQPIGKAKALINKDCFLNENEHQWLVNFFGKENVFDISKKEMSLMYCNLFSISEEVVISEQGFTRLNNWLEKTGFHVEKVPYAEIAKQGGLLRCSTLPLERE